MLVAEQRRDHYSRNLGTEQVVEFLDQSFADTKYKSREIRARTPEVFHQQRTFDRPGRIDVLPIEHRLPQKTPRIPEAIITTEIARDANTCAGPKIETFVVGRHFGSVD